MLFDEIDQTVVRRRDNRIPESNSAGSHLADPIRFLWNDDIGIQGETSNSG